MKALEATFIMKIGFMIARARLQPMPHNPAP
jgi:hypothetical protein